MRRYMLVALALPLLLITIIFGCGGEDGSGGSESQLEASRQQVDETRSELLRAREQLRQEQQRADQLLGQLQEQQSGHSGFVAALAVAFAAVLAVVLLLQLLVKERRARETLAKLMRWVRRRGT